MTADRRAALVEKVAKAVALTDAKEGYSETLLRSESYMMACRNIATAAIDLIRAEVLEEAAAEADQWPSSSPFRRRRAMTSETDDEFLDRIDLSDMPIRERERLRALARRGAAVQWRPIEEAPKDGTQFLVWDAYYGVRVGTCYVRSDHDDWLSYMDAFKGSSKGGLRATHWMPLPPTPASRRDE